MRKSYSKDFKAKVAFEAMHEDRTLAELSKIYDVHPNMIRKWKEQALASLPEAFARGKSQEQKTLRSQRGRIPQNHRQAYHGARFSPRASHA